MRQPIYVIGHKNPDTDSIVSAIAYANLKRELGFDALAARAGSVSSETEYLLERFGFDYPTRIYSAKSLLKDIECDQPLLCDKSITVKQALKKLSKSKNKVLFVVDKKDKLLGVVSLGDLNSLWSMDEKHLEKLFKKINIEDIIKTFKGELVNKGDGNLSGKIHMFPSLKSNVQEGSIVLLRNQNDIIQYCLDLGAKLLIVTTSSPISQSIIEMAKYGKTTIITTQASPFDVARGIFQLPRVENVMVNKNKIIYFKSDDIVDDVSKTIAKSRKRAYPVVDSDGKVIASISRYHLFNYEKKRFVLVDHNEAKQMVDDIDEGEVIEIVDHHRFGGFETDNPISITTKVVGATSSIIASFYFENKVELSKNMAGLLLGAIISDTMNFKSPTTTNFDLQIKEKLEKISEINSDELSACLINAGESLLDKRMIQIVYDDFKEFTIEGKKVGLSQTICKSKEEYLKLKDDLSNYLLDACKSSGYDLMISMLTNPNGTGSYLISEGDKKAVGDSLFKENKKEGFVEGLVSRKKQLLPAVIAEMGK